MRPGLSTWLLALLGTAHAPGSRPEGPPCERMMQMRAIPTAALVGDRLVRPLENDPARRSNQPADQHYPIIRKG